MELQRLIVFVDDLVGLFEGLRIEQKSHTLFHVGQCSIVFVHDGYDFFVQSVGLDKEFLC